MTAGRCGGAGRAGGGAGGRWGAGLAGLALAGWALGLGACGRPEGGRGGRAGEERVAPVAVAAVEVGTLEQRRTFSGTLSARAEFVVAGKIQGRIENIMVDIADPVNRGQVVAVLDDAEYVQAVAQAEADQAVAEAERMQAGNALEIARREIQRVETLRDRGVASDAEFDTAQVEFLGAEAGLRVAEARLTRARAELATARIRLSYTQITADWPEGDDVRVVAERYLDEGQTLAANVPILLITQLDPVVAEVYVTEKDYPRLHAGQAASLQTDAFPGETFQGQIERVSPIFREATRQARVEIRLPNPDLRLKPGMFARATITLDRVEGVRIIPESALTQRKGESGVFRLEEDGQAVRWVAVTPGIREEGRVEVVAPELTGLVVTLGQHLIDDGAKVTVPAGAAGGGGSDPAEPAEGGGE